MVREDSDSEFIIWVGRAVCVDLNANERVSFWAYVRLSVEVSLCWLNPGSVKNTAFFWHPRLPPLLHLSLLPWYNTDVSLCSLSRSFQPLTSLAVIHFPSLYHSESRLFKYWEMIKVYSIYLITAVFSIAVIYGWSMHLWRLHVNFGCWQQGFNHNYWIKNNNNKSIEKKHCFFSNSPKSMLKYKSIFKSSIKWHQLKMKWLRIPLVYVRFAIKVFDAKKISNKLDSLMNSLKTIKDVWIS